MDRRIDRVRCEEGEEQCDVCWRNQIELAASPRVVQRSPGFSALSSSIVHPNTELPALKGSKGESESGFGDSGIGRSMSSPGSRASTKPNIASSPVSEDQGFINQSPIPGRFQTSKDKQMQVVFEKQQ
jgi:hypothetical protein